MQSETAQTQSNWDNPFGHRTLNVLMYLRIRIYVLFPGDIVGNQIRS